MTSLILISGPPGVGKSTLALKIARQLNGVILDKDCIDEPFSPNDRGEHYSATIEPKVLQALLNLACLNLKAQNSVLLDLPWTHILINTPEWVSKIQELCEKTQTALKVVELKVDQNVLFERIKSRGLQRDQIKLSAQGWEKFLRSDRIGETNPLEHLAVDFNDFNKVDLHRILQYLET